MGWQWLEDAAVLPRVFSFSHTVSRLNSQDDTLQLTSTSLMANPGHLQPYLWQVKKKIGPRRTHLGGPWSVSTQNILLFFLKKKKKHVLKQIPGIVFIFLVRGEEVVLILRRHHSKHALSTHDDVWRKDSSLDKQGKKNS